MAEAEGREQKMKDGLVAKEPSNEVMQKILSKLEGMTVKVDEIGNISLHRCDGIKQQVDEQEANVAKLMRQRDTARMQCVIERGRKNMLLRSFGLNSDQENEDCEFLDNLNESPFEESEEECLEEGEEETETEGEEEEPIAQAYGLDERQPGITYLTRKDAVSLRRASNFHARLIVTALIWSNNVI